MREKFVANCVISIILLFVIINNTPVYFSFSFLKCERCQQESMSEFSSSGMFLSILIVIFPSRPRTGEINPFCLTQASTVNVLEQVPKN